MHSFSKSPEPFRGSSETNERRMDMLQFLGRGSAFADEHNAAFFEQADFVRIRCPSCKRDPIKASRFS